VVALLVSLRRGSGTLGAVGVGLVVGGAIGNVIDRLFRSPGWLRGAVVDFIDFQWFPVFNVADMAINIGAGLLILGSILAARREQREVVEE
jgi:signal peptidase II